MENQTQKPWYLNSSSLSTIREFFAWLLCIYMLYWNKQLDGEKTKILQVQIEVLQKQKENEIRLLQITDKIVNKNESNQNDNSSNTSNSD